MSNSAPVIVWFRQDLRVSDNPALAAASASGAPVLPLYILDDDNAGDWAMGAASRWWLHHSLVRLSASLSGHLALARGDAGEVLPRLVEESGASAVYWNRCYEPWRIRRDTGLKSALADSGVDVHSFNGTLLFEPHTIKTKSGGPYKVFTPFWRNGCLGDGRTPDSPRQTALPERFHQQEGLPLAELGLLPEIRWDREIAAQWTPGEEGAAQRLERFLADGLDGYGDGRNRPDQEHVSRLSPHLHFGEISPRQVWQATRREMAGRKLDGDGDTFLSEIGWREFSYNLLFHWPDLPAEPLQEKFHAFQWRQDDEHLRRWQRGLTGYPIVDAGMRQLWRTGYVHNRVRMIVGSFLVKNLRLHWRHGEDWFWDTLLDADLASNSAGWQWIAGCGADAAPYFRVFNPVTQGRKFDPDGDYVRTYVPELGRLPPKLLHAPWEASAEQLRAAKVRLGEDYPEPVVDLKASRESALAAFAALREQAGR